MTNANRVKYDLALARIAEGKWSVDPDTGTISNHRGPIGHVGAHGYIYLGIWRTGGKFWHLVAHRIVWEHVHGPIMDVSLEINHINGVKDDNRIANLELVTGQANIRHAHATGLSRQERGEHNRTARLSNADVVAIRRLGAEGVLSSAQIGARYGVSRQHVRGIIAGRQRRYG